MPVIAAMPTIAPVICPSWRLRGLTDPGGPHPIGAECVACGRDVALPRASAGQRAICLYCALDCGMVPADEIQPR